MDENALGLVADIGRVSVRFALTGGAESAGPRDIRSYHAGDFPTFTNALLAYLDDVGQREARLRSVLAVAGAVRSDTINLTGSRWYISLSGVESVLRHRPIAINECAANALALTRLAPSDFLTLHGPAITKVDPSGNFLVIGPGTGLGVAALISSGGKLHVVQSEAGHKGLAPRTEAERTFAEHLQRHGISLNAEALLSAGGLVTAYAALSADRVSQDLSPEDVTRGREPAARAATDMFVEYLGAFVGDLVLTFGAWQGVFLTGAIARSIHERIAEDRFRKRMIGHNPFSRQLAAVPVAAVNRNDLELAGAAVALADT